MIFASFATPLLIWCIFAYTPGLWDVSRKIHITTDLKGGEYPTIYRTGHLMEGERFAGFQSLVREANEGIRAYRDGGGDLPEGISVSSRSNSKVLRKLHRVAVLEKWMTEEQSTDNEAFYEVWKGLAEGELAAQPNLVSAENLEIIRANWDILKAGGETYNSETFPSEPLYHLLPDGVKSIGRPSYLPAPHEVFVSAWKLFTGSSTRVDSLMGFRYLDSLKIVFLGFFFGCLIGLPVGLLAGTFDFFSKYFEPFVDFFRYMPAPAFGTLMVFLLGSHDAPKVALVFLGTVCQAILMTANTTRQLDKGLLDAAQTLGARKINLVFEVVVPGIVHNL
ncbi:MAG: ABC transporter permease subunit, partial [Planctomycetota bacterium]